MRQRQERCFSAWDRIKFKAAVADKQIDFAIAELRKPKPDMKKVQNAEQNLKTIISDVDGLKNQIGRAHV